MDGLNKELAVKTAEFTKEVAEDLIRPTTKIIGQNIGMLVDGIFGWLGCWGEKQKIKQEQNILEFKNNLNKKISNITDENLIEPKISIIGPAIEACKYYFEEDYYREMFSNLVASSCSSKTIDKIHPAFIEIIKQLSPLDAKLLNMFKYYSTYPVADINGIHIENKISPYVGTLFFFKDINEKFNVMENLRLTTSLDNLVRLGIVMKNRAILEMNFNYEEFKNHFMYKNYDKAKDDDCVLKIIPGRIELTEFGRAFISCCLSEEK